MSKKLPAVAAATAGVPVNDTNDKQPKAYKFGQVDQNLLISRLYSTPLKPENSHQKYMLDMGATNFQKPLVRKLEPSLPKPEPIVNFQNYILFFHRS